MSASSQIEVFVEPPGDTAEAVYFESGQEHLFGWLHRPAAGREADVGLVICNPFGYESICSHRSVRAFAEAAADIGVAALRFDYRGTGDSEDIDPAIDQIDAWVGDVVAAVTELRRRTGVQRVGLLGFRLGALLAALAARDCGGICALMAVAPVVNGRRYVKELRTTRLAALLGAGAHPAPTAPVGRAAGASASLEVSGYLLSAATLSALARIDLCAAPEMPAPQALVIDAESLPVARGWSDALVKAGVNVAYRALPGTVEMLMTAPQFAVVPQPMIAAMRDLLRSLAAPATTGDRMPPRVLAHPASLRNSMKLSLRDGSRTVAVTERALRFGPDAALFGVVTEPARDDRRRRAVILLNPGVDHHIGASRLYVPLARQWAVRGYVVLRMDLAGIGDSATRPGYRDDDVFPDSALDDIRAAIDCLRQNYHVSDISLIGLCSGAYHALRAAAAGIQVHRILMINPQNYFWKEGMSLNDLQLAEVVRNPGVYRQQVWSAAAWKRVISGEVNLYRIVKIYVQRLYLAIVHSSRNLARRLGFRLADDLGRELEEIAARGVGIAFVFARGEPGIDLLKLEGGASVSRLGSQCRVHILDHGDHVFSHHDSRAALEKVLGDELFKRAHLTAV